MDNREQQAVTNHLSDVHAIASELLKTGEIGTQDAVSERSKVIRVERQPAFRSASPGAPQLAATSMAPVAHPGIEDELRRLNRQLETIRKSVEFTEAHMATAKKASDHAQTTHDAPAVSPRRGGWLLAFSNVLLAGLLGAEIYAGMTSRWSMQAYAIVMEKWQGVVVALMG